MPDGNTLQTAVHSLGLLSLLCVEGSYHLFFCGSVRQQQGGTQGIKVHSYPGEQSHPAETTTGAAFCLVVQTHSNAQASASGVLVGTLALAFRISPVLARGGCEAGCTQSQCANSAGAHASLPPHQQTWARPANLP